MARFALRLSVLTALLAASCSAVPEPTDLAGVYRGVGFDQPLTVTLHPDGGLVAMAEGAPPVEGRWQIPERQARSCLLIELTVRFVPGNATTVVPDQSNPCAIRILDGTVRILLDADRGVYLDRQSF